MFLLLLALQKPLPAAPMITPGANIAFHQSAYAVEKSIAAGNFAEAKKQVALLPKRFIKIKWDESKVPAPFRADFEAARDEAISKWRKNLPGTEFKVSTQLPDIKIDFEQVLAVPAGRSAPAPSVIFFSDSPNEPRLEAVIGLKRGNPLALTSRNEVFNEVGYAIGAYFGLSDSPFTGFFMARSDQSGQPAYGVGIPELHLALANLKLADALRASIGAKKILAAVSPPGIFVDPETVILSEATQGDKVAFSVQVSNKGNGPLAFEPTPDCGCITATGPQTLAPGKSTLIRGQIDTKEQSGEFNRHLIIASNDPKTPFIRIPVSIHINALYRLLGPDHAVTLTPENQAFDLFLALSSKATLKPTNARITGLKGTVTFEPWTGMMADKELNENFPTQKSGYIFHVKMDLTGVPGKNWAGLEVLTDDEAFKVLRYGFSVQTGIVTEPYQFFLGDIASQPREFKLVVSRPHKPFKIKRVVFDTPHLTWKNKTSLEEVHSLVIGYDGKADTGPFNGILRIFTDDPVQQEIDVPYAATVQ